MGQPIVVVERPSTANPGLVRFETNRALTGMGHERYRSDIEVRGDRPPDELARRLLAHGGVGSVHINGSVITVDLVQGATTVGLREIIETLYIHYPATTEGPVAPDAVPDGEEVTDDAELDERMEAAAPAAPDPDHRPPVSSEVAEAQERTAATASPAAPSADAVAAADEVTDADVQGAEGAAATLDQRPVDSSPSEPPADDAGDSSPPAGAAGGASPVPPPRPT